MASLSTTKNGYRSIQFFDTNGRRRTLRLGKMPLRSAQAMKVKIEHLAASAITRHPPDPETSRWVAGLDAVLADRLAAVGLIQARLSATLEPFLDEYIASREDVKASTKLVYNQARGYLVEHFGPTRDIRSITPGDADGFRLFLVGKRLADNTVRRRCGLAKQFFRAAERRKLIEANPFQDLVGHVRPNPERFHFVDRDVAQRVLDGCPDIQWRLIFALARFGGMRCPTEILELKWSDIDWDAGRMTVRSSKTEHLPGKASRQMPLFPELQPLLHEGFDAADEGAEYVITRYRHRNANLRTQLMKIMSRVGVAPWPKLFQNLRSTRETELAEQFPLHVVCAWIGNTEPVASKHYLQVTEAHFNAASGSRALQKAVQQPAETARNAPQASEASESTDPLNAVSADPCGRRVSLAGDCGYVRVGRGGLEPPTPAFSMPCSTN